MLVIVLVTLLFAALAVVAFVDKASDDLMVEAREIAGRRLRQEAYSALEVTLGVLEDFRLVNGGLRSPAEGWSDPLGFAGWAPREGVTAEITFEDESGKISLPHADPATMVSLFQAWGLTQTNSERLADALQGWMKKDHVPTSSQLPDYERVTLPYGPPLRSLRSYSELAAIDYAREVFYDEEGRPNELWRQFANAFSLFDFKQSNLNGGRSETLSAIGSLDASQRRQLDEYLTGTGSRAQMGPGFFNSPQDASKILGSAKMPEGYGTQISALRVIVTIHEGRTNFRLAAVIAPSGGATTVEAVKAAPKESNLSRQNTEQTAQKKANAATSDTGGAAKKLQYPFTLLEIRENGEISPVPAAPPPQA